MEYRVSERAYMITQEALKEILHYDPETGNWTWLVDVGRVYAGDRAGCFVDGRGYRKVSIRRTKFYLHRLAFLYMNGEWPKAQVDHINLVKSDMRWSNLREATRSQNYGNRDAYANNSSGFKGVWWHKQCQKWAAEIRVNRKGIKLGLFDSPTAAHSAYVAAAQKYFGEFARA